MVSDDNLVSEFNDCDISLEKYVNPLPKLYVKKNKANHEHLIGTNSNPGQGIRKRKHSEVESYIRCPEGVTSSVLPRPFRDNR